MISKDVVIIGGGAAGLMCALTAAKRGRNVVVLDHSEKIGRKIRISGGGRCNFTNIHSTHENFISRNPHFCKSALKRYTPRDFIALVDSHQISYHEKKLGQLFCDQSAQQIIDMLLRECSQAGAEVCLGARVSKIEKKDRFEIRSSQGDYSAESLVVATGGLSIPKIGATDFGYRIAKQFGLKLVPPVPALVPLMWQPGDLDLFAGLAGVSIDALVRCGKAEFRENILFTHRGLSGPAVLQISSYWSEGSVIEVDFLPGIDVMDVLNSRRDQRCLVSTVLQEFLPKSFVKAFAGLYNMSQPISQCSDKELQRVVGLLKRWQCSFAATEGYRKAEVTRGGVDTEELSSRSMESQKVPGLFFIGEVVDVTGHLGGHNFQWAWSSGHAAGEVV